jgi:AAHS family 4-hydroxybenzoate transporter-like MFS transporter
LLFSLFTLATPLAGRFDLLLAVRIAAGLGLGGATPCFLALMSDYAPKRYRATLVSLVWCGFPLGGMLGSLGAAYLISHVSWQAIFLVGGLAPLAVALVLAAGVQESPQFHLGSGRGLEKARRTLARFAGWPAGDDVELISAERKLPGVPLRHLFGERRALFTPLLWGVFAAAFGTLTVLVLWTPALLKEEGVAAAQAAIVVAVSNLGAMIGQGSAGRLVDRLGPVRVMAPAFFVGAVFFALLTLPGLALNARFVCAALAGACLGLSSSGAIALTAVSYPAQVRSSAIGWGMAVGRGGQVVAPLLAGAILGWGAGPAPVFIVMAAVPIVGALFVLLLAGERRRASPPVAA